MSARTMPPACTKKYKKSGLPQGKPDFYEKVYIPAKQTTNRLRFRVIPIGCLFYLRIIFSYCCCSSFRRGLNIISAMKKLPIQWEMSKGIPEIHLVTA